MGRLLILTVSWSFGVLFPAASASGQDRGYVVVRTIESDLLANPFGVVEGSGGVLFVSDPLNRGIFRISPSGEWMQIAREGQGPGELRVFGGLGLRGDTLNAPDPGSRSVVLFDEEGVFLDVLRLDLTGLFPVHLYWMFPVLLIPENRVLVVPQLAPDQVARGLLERVPVLSAARSGDARDTVMIQPVAGSYVRLETGSGINPSVPQPFLSRPTVAPDRRGESVVLAEEVPVGLRLTWSMLPSGQRFVQEIPVDRIPLRPGDVNREFQRLSRNAEDFNLQPARYETIYRRAVTIPDHEPVFTAAFAASGGYVWLRAFTVTDEVVWTRHSVRGEPVVRITLSRRDAIMDAADDWLWVVRSDEWDVPRLVKLRVSG